MKRKLTILNLVEEMTLGFFENIKYIQRKKDKYFLYKKPNYSIILLPGFMTHDYYMKYLKRNLQDMGFKVYGMKDCVDCEDVKIFRHINIGWRNEFKESIKRKIDFLLNKGEEPPLLIGWSLGGIYSRMVKMDYGDKVGGVITLGSPITKGFSKFSPVKPIYSLLGNDPKELDEVILKLEAEKNKKNIISISCKKDGLIEHGLCLDSETENYTVNAYHMSVMNSKEVFNIISQKIHSFDL